VVVLAQQARRKVAAVAQGHHDLLGAGGDMLVGDDETVATDEKAGAQSLDHLLVTARHHHLFEDAAGQGALAPGHRDVDHRRGDSRGGNADDAAALLGGEGVGALGGQGARTHRRTDPQQAAQPHCRTDARKHRALDLCAGAPVRLSPLQS
jgi:hypothetical protein